ncbi:MAG: hypothetical protein ACRDT4_17930 [Micromonosporaceae bacterium]
MSELVAFVSQTVERHGHAMTGRAQRRATSFVEQLSTRDPVNLVPNPR